MAFRRSQQAATVLLATALLGGAGAQGSGTHPPAGQAPPAAVLGITEVAARSDPDLETAWSGRSPRLASTPVSVPPAGPPAAADPRPAAAAPLLAGAPTDGGAGGGAGGGSGGGAGGAPADGGGGGATAAADELVAGTLAAIRYPWRSALPGWQVVFLPGRSGVRGMTFPGERRIELYVRDRDSAGTLVRVLAHELGHALDVQHNDARDRARWRAVRGADPSVPWWPGDGAEDLATLAGDFAEAFMAWQLGVPGRSVAAGELTDEHLAVLASLLP
jgi:hypothetical protein